MMLPLYLRFLSLTFSSLTQSYSCSQIGPLKVIVITRSKGEEKRAGNDRSFKIFFFLNEVGMSVMPLPDNGHLSAATLSCSLP